MYLYQFLAFTERIPKWIKVTSFLCGCYFAVIGFISNPGSEKLAFIRNYHFYGSVAGFVASGVFAYSKHLIRKISMQSTLVAPPGEASSASELNPRSISHEIDVRKLTEISKAAFPSAAYSTVPPEVKHEFYMSLAKNVPESLILIEDTTGKVVGYSVMVPIRSDVYAGYRSQRGYPAPWAWREKEFIDVKSAPPVHIYSQVTWLARRGEKQDSKYLTWIYIKHLSKICRGNADVTIVSPRLSRHGKMNAATLGFEPTSKVSTLGFPLFELDLRKCDELGRVAGSFKEKLKEQIALNSGR